MQDDFIPRQAPVRSRRSGGGLIFAIALAVLIAGALALGWLAWSGRIALGEGNPSEIAETAAPAALNSGNAPLPAPQGPQAAPTIAVDPGLAMGNALDQRLVGLEQRMARLDQQAQAAAGNAGRAEGLLIALAVRRSLDRGAPLDYLSEQLQLHFAGTQPAAVRTVLAAAQAPVTLDSLDAELARLGPLITSQANNASGWLRVRREIGDLFTIRSDPAATIEPADRINRARLLLRVGQVDAAIAAVRQLPGTPAGHTWIGAAQRYATTRQALDQIERAAILQPVQLPGASIVPANDPALGSSGTALR